MWKCPNCASEVDDGFGACWQCGTTQDGTEDPDFVREVDAAELPADWVPRIQCANCGYVGKVLLKHLGYRWWMLALLILLFPAGLLGVLLLMIVGNSRYKVCPKCGCDNKLKDATTEPTATADLVWQVAHDADAEAFRQNKLYLLLIALTSLAAIVAVLIYFNWHWFSGFR